MDEAETVAEALEPRQPLLVACAQGARREDRPARKGARHLDDVLLRVAAVDAEGVQLHQLAGVVLVEPLRALGGEPVAGRRAPRAHRRSGAEAIAPEAAAAETPAAEPSAGGAHLVGGEAGGGGGALGRHRAGVVEVEQHRRVAGGGLQQVAQAPQRVRADGVALVVEHREAGLVVGGGDVEVVEPEVGHQLGELVLGIDRAHQLLPGGLGQQVALAVVAVGDGEADQVTADALAVGVEPGAAVGQRLRVEVARDHPRLARLAQDQRRRRVGLEGLIERQPQRREAPQAAVEVALGEVGGELARQPAVHPHRHHPVDVARARTVGEALEQVGGRLALAEPRLPPGPAQGGRRRGGGEQDGRQRQGERGGGAGDGARGRRGVRSADHAAGTRGRGDPFARPRGGPAAR